VTEGRRGRLEERGSFCLLVSVIFINYVYYDRKEVRLARVLETLALYEVYISTSLWKTDGQNPKNSVSQAFNRQITPAFLIFKALKLN
jgi:hypothetical protein